MNRSYKYWDAIIRAREAIEKEYPFDTLYSHWYQTSFSSEHLWSLHEASVTFALWDALYRDMSRHQREWMCVMLLQRGWNG